MNGEKRAPLIIAALYALVGALWIFLSDKLLALFTSTAPELARWETYKGWLFILVTSCLLYLLVRGYMKRLILAGEALELENREFRLVQAALIESEEQFHNMFIKHSAMMYLADPDTGRILDANEAARRFYGYSADEFKKLGVSNLEVFPGGELRETNGSGRQDEGHYVSKHRLAGGDTRDVEIYSTQIRLTEKEFLFAVVHDVTVRREAESALRNSEMRFRSLVETTSDWIWEIDENDRFVYSSPKVEELLGFKPGEVIGKTPFDFMPANEIMEKKEFFHSCKEKARPFAGLENRSVHRDGRIVVLESSGVPVFDGDGLLSGYRGIARDITGNKQLEEQLRHAQKMEAIGELAGGVAHDFNNILTAIMGYVYILQMKIEDPTLGNYVEQISYSAQRAASLVAKLLAFGRKQIIYLQPVKINETIRKAGNLLSRVIREDIEIRTSLSDEDQVVLGDEGQIEQVIMNLATNARDAMPSGGMLTIKSDRQVLDREFVHAHGYGAPGTYAVITFTDTGCGMDVQTKARIFEPFFTTKEVGKGTGLGLSIVYGIIKQHRGYIDVASEPGKGSTFSVYLPLADKVPDKPVSRQAATHEGGRGIILVGEDDPDARGFIKTMLEEFGYSVIEADNGVNAVERYRENIDRVRLVLLDVIMPKQNGLEAYEEMKKINPAVKAIFLSGYPERIPGAGSLPDITPLVMEKPVEPGILLEKIKSILG